METGINERNQEQMIEENAEAFIIVDGKTDDFSRLLEIQQNSEMGKDKNSKSKMVYEVIRLIDGVPLFFEDHYERMTHSFAVAEGKPASGPTNRNSLISSKGLRKQINQLIEANNKRNCNVKFIAFTGDSQYNTVGYISKNSYPTAEMVSCGVPTKLYWIERENPNIKLVDLDYKEKINRIKSENGVYELLLVDRNRNLREGSVSNLFFVKDNVVYTAPAEKVLKGITRKYIMETCIDSGYPVKEEFTTVDELDEVEGVFISGTSPKVLPICSIGDREYSSAQHPVIVKIRDTYDRLLQEYIDKHR